MAAAEKSSQQITIRLDARILARADALLELVAHETGRDAARSDVLREALVRGLRDLERQRERADK